MRAGSVALIPSCAECTAVWLPADEERWQALPTDDEPPEIVFYCPECAEREFGPGLVRESRELCYSFSARANVPVCSITIAAGISCPGTVR
jgi:hypothetical protein